MTNNGINIILEEIDDLVNNNDINEEYMINKLNENLLDNLQDKFNGFKKNLKLNTANKLGKYGDKLSKKGYRAAAALMHKKSSEIHDSMGNKYLAKKHKLKCYYNAGVAALKGAKSAFIK